MLAHQIKTASDLRDFIESTGRDSHFFDRKTMRFFGDTMKNYGVSKVTIRVSYDKDGNYIEEGEQIEAWELFRRRAVKHGLHDSRFFRADNFHQAYPIKD